MPRGRISPSWWLLGGCLVVVLGRARAGAQAVPAPSGSAAPRLHLWFDLSEQGHSRIDFPPAGKEGVPGVVAVNRKPFRCDLHRQDFATEEAFAAHLRAVHKLSYRSLGEMLYRAQGQIHFPGGS